MQPSDLSSHYTISVGRIPKKFTEAWPAGYITSFQLRLHSTHLSQEIPGVFRNLSQTRVVGVVVPIQDRVGQVVIDDVLRMESRRTAQETEMVENLGQNRD